MNEIQPADVAQGIIARVAYVLAKATENGQHFMFTETAGKIEGKPIAKGDKAYRTWRPDGSILFTIQIGPLASDEPTIISG